MITSLCEQWPLDIANPDPFGMIGRIYVGNNYTHFAAFHACLQYGQNYYPEVSWTI